MPLAQRLYSRYGPTLNGVQAIARKTASEDLEELLDLVQSDPECANLLRDREVARDELRAIFFGLARTHGGNALVMEKFIAASALLDIKTLPYCIDAFRATEQAHRLSALTAQLFTYFSQSRATFS